MEHVEVDAPFEQIICPFMLDFIQNGKGTLKEVALTKRFSQGLDLLVGVIHPDIKELFALLEDAFLQELRDALDLEGLTVADKRHQGIKVTYIIPLSDVLQ